MSDVARDPLALTACPECGYLLEGLPSAGACPECGEKYDQQFIVLFGETPEGIGRTASRVVIIALIAMGAFVAYTAQKRGQLVTRSVFIMLGYLLVYVSLWSMRQFSLKRDILFQVWMNERGFAVRRPRAEGAIRLGRVFSAWSYSAWPIFIIASSLDDRGPVSGWFIMSIAIMVLFFIVIEFVLHRPKGRRRVITGDPRQPTLTRWERNDAVRVELIRANIARLRITSCSYLGEWKWYEWKGVDAVVRLSDQQVPALRDRINHWIFKQSARPRAEDAAHA